MTAVFKWMIVILLLMAVAGGGGAYWYYVRSDEMLRAEVLRQLSAAAPELKFSIERANFDFKNRVRIYGVAVHLPGDVEPTLEIPETVLTLDKDQLTDALNVSVERIRLIQPRLRAVRQSDGLWNWQGITLQSTGSQLLPHFEVEHGAVIVELHREREAARVWGDSSAVGHDQPGTPNDGRGSPDPADPARGRVRKLKLVDLNITAVPAASRKITGSISTRIDVAGSRIEAGPLVSTFEFDLDSTAFGVEAKWAKLSMGDDLFDLASELSPMVESKLDQARMAMAEMAAKQVAAVSVANRPPADNLSHGSSPTQLRTRFHVPVRSNPASFGLKCDCNLHLKLRRQNPSAPLLFEVLTDVHSGQISNALLPFPLYALHGSVFADSQQVIFRDFRAENGVTSLLVNGHLTSNQSPTGSIRVRNLTIDDPLKARLPAEIRKVLQPIALDGICDLDFGTVQIDGKTSFEGVLELSKGGVTHERFPYPIRELHGTVRVRGHEIRIKAAGKGSGVPVRLDAYILNPGPANQSEFLITADHVPINKAYLDACRSEVQKAIKELDLQGSHNLQVRISKPAGIGPKYTLETDIKLVDCSCCFERFPYRISRLTGDLQVSDEKVVFRGLQGRHDATLITGTGAFFRSPGQERLDLTLVAENAAFDRSLELAIPHSVHAVWKEFQPNGRFDTEIKIDWVPGHQCKISLPVIKVADTEVTIRGFPWPLQAVRGEFSYDESKLKILRLSARHDDTQIRGRGDAYFAPGEPWRVRFDELHVDDLIPNSTFRDALPQNLQKVFRSLTPTGKFSIATTRQDPSTPSRPRHGYVELAGGGPVNAVSAAWDLQVIMADCAVTAGIVIDGIHGRVDLAGQSNGQNTTLIGQLDLDSVSIFRQPSGQAHQISNLVGPIRLVNGEFTAGSKEMTVLNGRRAPVLEQIRGDAIDGKLNLNVYANLVAEPEYRLGVELNQAKLETYAQQYMRGQTNLAGIMKGWLFLWGKGQSKEQVHGRGQLMIAPAALYELPLFVQIFRVLRLDAQDRTAFKSAHVDYTIENSRFNFERIELLGSTISLRGRGYVRFDGAMQLDFGSELPKSRMYFPVVHEIAGALSRNWVGVKVTGSVGRLDEPQIIPFPEFDEAFKQFLGSFDPPPQRPAARAAPSSSQRTQN